MDKLLQVFHRKNDSNQALDRSTYSLVSCGNLTEETVQSWIRLPDEVKSDPSMEHIRRRVEEIETNSNPTRNSTQSVPDLDNIDECIEKLSNEEVGEVKISHISPSTREGDRPAIKKAKYYTKMTLLLACWVFFTAIFLTYNEKNEVFRSSAVSLSEEKSILIDKSDSNLLEVKLLGPFLSKQSENNLKDLKSFSKLYVWIEDLCINETIKISKVWNITLLPDLDFYEGQIRTKNFETGPNFNSTLRIRTNATTIVPFTISITPDPLDPATGVIYSVILLCGLYILIIFEVINRTMAAIIVSTSSLAALALVGERPTLTQLVSWLDVETLLLLFSMMILVAIMAETGLFDYLAVFAFEVTQGRLWPLIYLLVILTAVLSTFLDNVTTILLMSPVVIRLCEVMDLDPVPILMFMAIYSNIGGTATPVGDPPNVIVASNKAVVEAGINFTNFTAHMGLGIIFVVIQTSIQIRFMYRNTNKLRQRVPREIQDLRHQITIWRRAVDSLPHLSDGVTVVRQILEKKINKLTVKLEKMIKESSKRACPKETFKSTLAELKDKYKIRDKVLLVKSSVAIVFVVTVFFLHSIPELNRLSLAMTALLGAILLLILADRADLEPILHRVEWSTLLFFAALFVLMEALSELGLILYIGGLMEQLIVQVDEGSRLAVALMLILWISGTISAFVDNIPLTTMMVRVVVSIGLNPSLNLPMAPLIWALLLGACLGGNGTLIGASANVVCAGVAEQHGYRFTFMHFLRVGFPIMIGHLLVASAYLLICHCAFTWH